MEDRACDVIVQFVSVPGVDSAVPVGVAGPRTVNPLRGPRKLLYMVVRDIGDLRAQNQP